MITLSIPSKLSHQKKAMIRKCMRKAELIDSEDSEKLLLITGSGLLISIFIIFIKLLFF